MTTDDLSDAPQHLQPDSTFGPYRIVRRLGSGGMGSVYEAEQRSDGRVVALKVLTVDFDDTGRERFLREGRTAAGINHPNTVYIYGTDEIGGTPVIAMELVPGGTLEDKVTQRGGLPWTEAADDCLQVIDGLTAAFDAGVLHRDVKPANCFVGAGGVVKIGDFGLSKPVEGEEQQRLTQAGVFLGTPVFSSPEQLLGETLDERSDIYAVGVTFYYLLTGKLPFTGSSLMQVVAAVMNGVPAPLRAYRDDVPAAVVDVVAKAMARDRADRYQNYEQFRAALAELRAVDAEPATPWDRLRGYIVDSVVTLALAGGVNTVAVPKILAGLGIDPTTPDWRVNSLRSVIGTVIALIVVGIPEGLFGASVGKWLLGIRVRGPDGRAPGYPRAAARILLLAVGEYAGMVGRIAGLWPQTGAAPFAMAMVFPGLLLVTARRRNGWRLVHDIITGTRVVRRNRATGQRRAEVQRAPAPRLTGNEPRVGPYATLGAVRDGSPVTRGWDSTISRPVWIVPRPVGSPEVSPARRSVSRLTRLRWVNGRRATTEAWDAFEAPIGTSLDARLARPVPWKVQQAWVEDLCAELIGANEDGTAMAGLSADSLLVTPTDRLVFIEGDAATAGVASAAEQIALITEVLDRVGAVGGQGQPLPRHAMRAIADIRAASEPAEALSLIRTTIGRPVTVTRQRRAMMIAAVVTPMLVLPLTASLSTRAALRADRSGLVTSALPQFVADSEPVGAPGVAPPPGPGAASPGARLRAAMQSLYVLARTGPDTITWLDTLRRRRRLAETYIAAELADRARGPRAAVLPATPRDSQRVAAILARNRNVDSSTAREARALVDGQWHGIVPGSRAAMLVSLIPLVTVALYAYAIALAATIAGLLARRGPLLRAFQVDVVTADGAPAGTLRILIRTLATWSVLLVLPVLYLLAPHVSAGALTRIVAVCGVGAVIACGVGVLSALINPARGLAERMSGTCLVPE